MTTAPQMLEDETDCPAVGSPVDRWVMPLEPERAAFVAWLRLSPDHRDEYWKQDITMWEHDAAHQYITMCSQLKA